MLALAAPGGRPWGQGVALTELGFSPMFASTYVSVLGSTASSASRIFSTGMSSLALLVDSTSFSFLSLPRCRSSCTAVGVGAVVSPPSGAEQRQTQVSVPARAAKGGAAQSWPNPHPVSAPGLASSSWARPEHRAHPPLINSPN